MPQLRLATGMAAAAAARAEEEAQRVVFEAAKRFLGAAEHRLVLVTRAASDPHHAAAWGLAKSLAKEIAPSRQVLIIDLSPLLASAHADRLVAAEVRWRERERERGRGASGGSALVRFDADGGRFEARLAPFSATQQPPPLPHP